MDDLEDKIKTSEVIKEMGKSLGRGIWEAAKEIIKETPKGLYYTGYYGALIAGATVAGFLGGQIVTSFTPSVIRFANEDSKRKDRIENVLACGWLGFYWSFVTDLYIGLTIISNIDKTGPNEVFSPNFGMYFLGTKVGCIALSGIYEGLRFWYKSTQDRMTKTS